MHPGGAGWKSGATPGRAGVWWSRPTWHKPCAHAVLSTGTCRLVRGTCRLVHRNMQACSIGVCRLFHRGVSAVPLGCAGCSTGMCRLFHRGVSVVPPGCVGCSTGMQACGQSCIPVGGMMAGRIAIVFWLGLCAKERHPCRYKEDACPLLRVEARGFTKENIPECLCESCFVNKNFLLPEYIS